MPREAWTTPSRRGRPTLRRRSSATWALPIGLAAGRSRSWTSSPPSVPDPLVDPAGQPHTGTSLGFGDYEKLVALLGEAFDGTAQPGSDLPIAYTEFGVQSEIPESAQASYTNLHSPFARDAVSEETQAEYYRQALELAACQPTVIAVYFFHLFDEADLNRWQSGPYYADTKPKSSLPAIRDVALKARKGELADCS